MSRTICRPAGVFLALLLSGSAANIIAQSDVTQPSDAVYASSPNSPGSEGPANAIDGQPTKYLNFDGGRDGADNGFSPSGFAVTPGVGVTLVTGIAMQSANDAPERDPLSVLVEGSNDPEITSYDSGNWEVIAQIDDIPAWPDLFPDDHRFQTQTFEFANDKPYRHYRWTVLATQTTPNGCCMQIAEVEFLGKVLPPDVTQPGDSVIASSPNSPGSEGPANAIDNQPTKYLNFDGGRDGADNGFSPSGLVVSPSIGRTLVTGITMQSANDAPERDPRVVLLEGSNDPDISGFDSGNWEEIALIENIPAWTDVFPDDHRFQSQSFVFDNFTPYLHYRWTVLETQTTPNGCCMQIAEVELLGTGAPVDVTQPSDNIFASSPNSPGSEGPANAIDNQPTKYLNFDGGRDGADNGFSPSGFAVTPSVGATTIIGLAMQSANDAPERDPRVVRLEGSNDDEITSYDSGNWETIVEITDITPWTDLFPDDHRFQTQEFYFANKTAYKHYRWTVLETQTTPNGCCMQIAEVEFLAVTDQVDCDKAQFLTQPVNTPVLEGANATFFVEVNGPWPLQWLRNGEPIPGETGLSYTTPPVTTENAADVYSVEIVGCETSIEVTAQIFTPSDIKSVGINFEGEGANGAPTPMAETDIAGVHLQAYWNNHVEADGDAGALVDSDNNPTSITFESDTSGEWGAGTGDASPTQRMLNGLVHAQPGSPGTLTFSNVPDGEHAIIAHFVGIPLQFQDANYTVMGQTQETVYVRVINADEYNASPGFVRGTSTDPANRTLATYVRFDKIQPVNGQITLQWDTITTGFDRGAPVNSIQLLLNAPEVGVPPVITKNPQPAVTVEGGTIALTVEAQGDDITYQWRKSGNNLIDGGNISGATTDTLTIRSFGSSDEGIYSVVVLNSAGSVVSRNASVRLSTFMIDEDLVSYWPFDETSGNIAANAAPGGSDGTVEGTATWVPGRVDNALQFDGTSTYVFVEDYPKANRQLSGSAWVRIDSNIDPFMVPVFIQNADNSLGLANPSEQFEFLLIYDDASQTMRLSAAIAVGPNIARVTESEPFPVGDWEHVAFSADGAQIRLYRNAQLLGSNDYISAINSPTIDWLSIGIRLSGDPLLPDTTFPDYMHGEMDELALWTRGLTEEEVVKIYEAGLQGNALTTVELEPPEVSTPGELQISIDQGQVTVSWDAGTLQTAPTINGEWTDVQGPSPLTEPADQTAKFYRTVSP